MATLMHTLVPYTPRFVSRDDPGSIPGGNGGGRERRTRTAETGDRPAGRAYAPAPRRGPVAARGGGGAVAAVAKNEAEMSGHGFAGALRERVTVERWHEGTDDLAGDPGAWISVEDGWASIRPDHGRPDMEGAALSTRRRSEE